MKLLHNELHSLHYCFGLALFTLANVAAIGLCNSDWPALCPCWQCSLAQHHSVRVQQCPLRMGGGVFGKALRF